MSAKIRTTNKLLIDGPVLVILPGLAAAIGLNEAIILQQIHYLLQDPKNGRTVNGVRYIYNTYEEWKNQYFRFWSEPTIKRIFLNLEEEGLVKSIQADKSDYKRRKFYTLDYDAFNLKVESSESRNRKNSGKGSSSRVDQDDPLERDQIDPVSIKQREQQRKEPPTPRPGPGGSISSFPGKDPEAVQDHDDGTDPATAKPCSSGWATRAETIPGAKEFLSLAGLKEFPTSGRQSLARSFVNACADERISSRRLMLVAAVRGDLQLPRSPEELIGTFAAVAADAVQAARARIQEITAQTELRRSDPVYLLREMAAAEAQSGLLSPEDLCGSGMPLLFPRWLLMATLFKKGRQEVFNPIKEHVKPLLLEELAADSGVVPFLSQIGVSLQSLGLADGEVAGARATLLARCQKECESLRQLLGNDDLLDGCGEPFGSIPPPTDLTSGDGRGLG